MRMCGLLSDWAIYVHTTSFPKWEVDELRNKLLGVIVFRMPVVLISCH